MDVTVVVGTFGADGWRQTAQRAIRSAEPQAPVIHVHGATLAEARNAGGAQAGSEWLIFLDADDELDPGYVAAMSAAEHTGDLLGPATSYVRQGRPGSPKLWPEQDLRDGNHLVIGTAVRRAMFLEVGGFRDWTLYEDWCLWQRCSRAGASVAMVPDAVYRAHVRPSSRNRAPDRAERLRMHDAIRRANFPELYADAA